MNATYGQRAKCEQQVLAEMLGVTPSYLSRATRENWIAGGDLEAPVAEWAVWNRNGTKVDHYSIPLGWLRDDERLRYIGNNISAQCEMFVGTEESSLYDDEWLYVSLPPFWEAQKLMWLIERPELDRPS